MTAEKAGQGESLTGSWGFPYSRAPWALRSATGKDSCEPTPSSEPPEAEAGGQAGRRAAGRWLSQSVSQARPGFRPEIAPILSNAVQAPRNAWVPERSQVLLTEKHLLMRIIGSAKTLGRRQKETAPAPNKGWYEDWGKCGGNPYLMATVLCLPPSNHCLRVLLRVSCSLGASPWVSVELGRVTMLLLLQENETRKQIWSLSQQGGGTLPGNETYWGGTGMRERRKGWDFWQKQGRSELMMHSSFTVLSLHTAQVSVEYIIGE